MPTVTCPSCGEKGKIPKQLVGARIKCRKCSTSFFVTAPAAKAPSLAPSPGNPFDDPLATDPQGITVDGLDNSAWSLTAVATEPQAHAHELDHEPEPDESTAAFTAHPEPGVLKQYKVLTTRDKFFNGKFEITRLEDALNHYAREGWLVRSMATPHVSGFSGGPREELVILLER